jgi:hypothetical protein
MLIKLNAGAESEGAVFKRPPGFHATNIPVRCIFEIILKMLYYHNSGTLHLCYWLDDTRQC